MQRKNSVCDIKRINRLKSISFKMCSHMKEVDPLSVYSRNYVSKTGLTFSDLDEKIDKVSGCSSLIELKEEFIERDGCHEQVLKLAAANFCKQHVICPICSNRTQTRRRVKFNDPIRDQVYRIRSKDRYAYLLTYTVKDGEDLSERLEHLKQSKKAFRKMGQRRVTGKRSKGEASKIRAAISTIEIKRGENSGLWHVHSHDLVFTDQPLDYVMYDQNKKRKLSKKYGEKIPIEKLASIALNTVDFSGGRVPASKLSMEWLKASGGDSMSIEASPLKHVPDNCSAKRKRKLREMSFEQSIIYQAIEALKYFVKPSEYEPWERLILLNDTFNKRMVATYGEFRGIKGDDYNDEITEEDTTWIMKWNSEKFQYDEPQPGRVRDLLKDEEEKKCRSDCGKVLGVYRRSRKDLIGNGFKYGDDLFLYLDEAKRKYRATVRGIWSSYRHRISTMERMTSRECDKYSPVMALAGIWYPGSDSRDIYQAVFT